VRSDLYFFERGDRCSFGKCDRFLVEMMLGAIIFFIEELTALLIYVMVIKSLYLKDKVWLQQ